MRRQDNEQGKNQHVVKHPDGWAVKSAGNSKATKVTSTQKEAIAAAEDIARNQQSDTKIQGRDGKSEVETAMVTTHTHQQTRSKGTNDYIRNVQRFS